MTATAEPLKDNSQYRDVLKLHEMAREFVMYMSCGESYNDAAGACYQHDAGHFTTEDESVMQEHGIPARPELPEPPTAEGVTFRHVPDFPGYCVGDDGSVWTVRRKGGNARSFNTFRLPWLPVKQHTTAKGYRFVNLTAGGKEYTRPVHRLILETFVGPCPEGQEGCHYPDADKSNNRLTNLRWDTHAENMKDNYRDRPFVAEKRCRKCDATKSISDFYSDKRASDGLHGMCKPCHTETSLASRDPEKKRKANREYMRRRAALAKS